MALHRQGGAPRWSGAAARGPGPRAVTAIAGQVVEADRSSMPEVGIQPEAGGTPWPGRDAARCVAGHALDRAWQIEDRASSGP